MKKDANNQFNIISGDATKGDGGFGAGTLSLDNITPIIVDPEHSEVYIDMDALHGRSKIEKKVRFTGMRDEFIGECPDYSQYWIAWVKLDRNVDGPYYAGLGICEVLVSKEERRIRQGYKSMPEHVNTLDKALKSKVVTDRVDQLSKRLLRDYLKSFNEEYWKHSGEAFKQSLE
ncbi:YwhD family protein [Bacillus testis]|uniref:YwhD family protein n=1 Tax=Bacillus testis TaxID=1622072 RepID=UPI000AB560D9|nr:YwhD family protein [Bacillus testis]